MPLSHSRSEMDRQRKVALSKKNPMRAPHREERGGLVQPRTAHAPLIAAVLHKYQQRQLCSSPASDSGVMEKLPNNLQMLEAESHSCVQATLIEVSSPSESAGAANSALSSLPGTSTSGLTSSKKSTLVALQLTASDDEEQCGKLTRPEDILKRTRATMIPKSRKKAKPNSEEDEIGSTRKVESPRLRRYVCDREACRAHAFPLPTITDEKRHITGASLQSYKSLWDAMGGNKNKELFQRRVQNGVVPILSKRSLFIIKK